MTLRSFTACLGLAGLIAAAAVTVSSAPASAAAGGVTDPTKVDAALIDAWNAENFDDLRELFTDDAVLALPNHEPVRGGDEAVGLLAELRPVLGRFQLGAEVHKVTDDGKLHTLMASYAFESGVRITDTAVFARQSDGTWKYSMVQTGMRDPLR